MSKANKYSLSNLKRDFPTDEACLNFLFDTLHSRECSCGGWYQPLFKMVEVKGEQKLVGRRQFQCSKCRFQIAPMARTIFEKSSTTLPLWFHALFIFSNAKSGISAKEMERQLGVTYKCAWRILTLIRKSLKQSNKKLQGGDIEMDEAWIGGRKKAGKNNKNLGEAVMAKSVVTAAIQRKGTMKAEVSKYGATATDAKMFLEKNIDPLGTRLLTDTSNRFARAARSYNRQMVNHSQKEFVRGDVHVNSVEGFWSHFKRSIRGTHKVISKKYLQSYLDGFVFHYNNRGNDNQRFSALLRALLTPSR